MDNKQYISILSTATGTYTVNVESLNTDTSVSFAVTTAGSAGDDEVDMAKRLQEAFITVLTNTSADVVVDGVSTTVPLLYSGTPVYSSGSPLPTFQVTRTDHVLCVWSQCQFRVELDSSIGNQMVVETIPLLDTLESFESMAAIRGVDLETLEGTALTTAQKVLLIKTVSSQIVEFTRNAFVMSTYLEEITGRITMGVRTKKRPIVEFDSPRMRYAVLLWTVVSGVIRSIKGYDVNHSTGWIKWRHHSPLLDTREPFGYNNEVKITYVAGYMNIPFIVKEKLVSLAGIALSGDETGGDIAMLAGGTGRVQYTSGGVSDTVKYILTQLSAYQL